MHSLPIFPPKEKMWPSDHQTCTSSNSPSSMASNSPTFPSVPPVAPPHLLHTRHHCVATLKGQTSYTSSLLLAGEYLFTGSSDREIRCNTLTSLRNYESLSDDTMIIAGKGAVKSLIVSTDKLITAHQDHKIRIWRIDHTINNKNSKNNHHNKITHLATLPTLSDRATKLLLPKNHIQIRRHKKCTWIHHVDAVSALALSPDESLLYSVSWDRALKIWSTTDFKCLESIANAHDDAINAIALSENGHIYTASSDAKIKVWKRKSGEKKHSLEATLEKHKAGVNALALNGDSTVLYSGGSDRSIVVWMSGGGGGGMEAVGQLRGHNKSILCLATVGELVCSGSADKTVRIWRGREKAYTCLAVLDGHKGAIKCITMAFDHHSSDTSDYLIYSASLDCEVKIWKIFLPMC